MSFRLNPVKATCMKYGDRPTQYGIQGINDTCFGICAAFSGTNDIYDMDPVCSKACTDLVEKRKHELFGVGSCDHQVPYRPVAWQQVPRYVPLLMKRGAPKEEAKQICLKMCQGVPNLVKECEDHCILDSNAVDEMIQENFIAQDKIVSPTDYDYGQAKTVPLNTEQKTANYIGIALGILLLLVAIIAIYFRATGRTFTSS